jgi:hypothetical protein
LVAALALASVALTASPTCAQVTDDDPGVTEQRATELRAWMRAYTEWKEWADKWRGKREPGWFGTRERKVKPDPPVWLAGYCQSSLETEGDFAAGCRLLKDWQTDHATAMIQEQTRDERARREAPSRTRWWSNVHFDALWLTTQIPATYGVIGIHATHKISGRLHIFMAPGAMLLNIPTPSGNREWKPATDLGVSYQLSDFNFPGTKRVATLHLNVAKAWVVGNRGSFIDSSVELTGLSIAFK